MKRLASYTGKVSRPHHCYQRWKNSVGWLLIVRHDPWHLWIEVPFWWMSRLWLSSDILPLSQPHISHLCKAFLLQYSNCIWTVEKKIRVVKWVVNNLSFTKTNHWELWVSIPSPSADSEMMSVLQLACNHVHHIRELCTCMPIPHKRSLLDELFLLSLQRATNMASLYTLSSKTQAKIQASDTYATACSICKWSEGESIVASGTGLWSTECQWKSSIKFHGE